MVGDPFQVTPVQNRRLRATRNDPNGRFPVIVLVVVLVLEKRGDPPTESENEHEDDGRVR